jgi:hypothetical protein
MHTDDTRFGLFPQAAGLPFNLSFKGFAHFFGQQPAIPFGPGLQATPQLIADARARIRFRIKRVFFFSVIGLRRRPPCRAR